MLPPALARALTRSCGTRSLTGASRGLGSFLRRRGDQIQLHSALADAGSVGIGPGLIVPGALAIIGSADKLPRLGGLCAASRTKIAS